VVTEPLFMPDQIQFGAGRSLRNPIVQSQRVRATVRSSTGSTAGRPDHPNWRGAVSAARPWTGTCARSSRNSRCYPAHSAQLLSVIPSGCDRSMISRSTSGRYSS
jgi:hypothetical protein